MIQVYSNKELLQVLQNYYDENKELPKQKDFHKQGLPSFSVYFNRFGCLANVFNLINTNREGKRIKQKIFTNDELLNILKDETEKHLKNHLFLFKQEDFDNNINLPHSSIYSRRFGGHINAYKLIGYDYERFNKDALEKDMIDKFKELANKLNHTPNSREIDKYSKYGECYATKTYVEHFGSVYKLQMLCSMIPTKMGINRTREEMINDLIKLSNQIGYIPTAQDIDDCLYTCCVSQYIKEFRDMQNILLSAGFNKKDINSKIKTTKKGTICYSTYEYRIAKILENYNIEFEKEVLYKNVIYDFNKRYKFDFVININNINYYIEIFGITNNKKYDLKTQEKKLICSTNNIKLIEFYPNELWKITNEDLYKLLIYKIQQIKVDIEGEELNG